MTLRKRVAAETVAVLPAWLRDVFFPSREEAEKHRPKEVVWGADI